MFFCLDAGIAVCHLFFDIREILLHKDFHSLAIYHRADCIVAGL